MRIQSNCVSSEDIKTLTNTDKIVYCQSIGYRPWLINKSGHEIGYIEPLGAIYLGDDIIIKKIVIYKDKKLSDILTKKYRSKILIMSKFNDDWW